MGAEIVLRLIDLALGVVVRDLKISPSSNVYGCVYCHALTCIAKILLLDNALTLDAADGLDLAFGGGNGADDDPLTSMPPVLLPDGLLKKDVSAVCF